MLRTPRYSTPYSLHSHRSFLSTLLRSCSIKRKIMVLINSQHSLASNKWSWTSATNYPLICYRISKMLIRLNLSAHLFALSFLGVTLSKSLHWVNVHHFFTALSKRCYTKTNAPTSSRSCTIATHRRLYVTRSGEQFVESLPRESKLCFWAVKTPLVKTFPWFLSFTAFLSM